MKELIIKLSLIVTAFCTVGAVAFAQQKPETPLDNSAVIKLVRAGFKDKTVIAIIRSRPAQFDLSPDQLIELKRSGVSESVILVMLASDDAELTATDELGSDPFFGDSARAKGGAKTAEGETDIFGMNGGSNSRIRQRGAGSSSGGDTQATGSATVRILRPSVEPGGVAKLERTPTLTNESIVELVDAGFSEGTIIRRIEQSPAEFDLTPPKLAELRRRRVSDRVIAAMTLAMSDDSSSAPKAPGNTP
ncbi:MAG: hypothetical protein QOJ64_3885 [Acidobacteriota bacterium]|jgi:hypothetical protein|nr:hypothetical protein [Acidobacteriota bacterium]